MPERITCDQVARLADLARFRFDDTQLDRFTRELDAILGRIASIDELDLDDVQPTDHPLSFDNVWRPDDIGPTLDPDEALAGAPSAEDDLFSVPTILGEAP